MAEIAIVMPKMSMTMEEGTMVAWHKQPGDEVGVGDVVCEVATDKVDMEVEATVAGVLARLVADDGDVVAVGEPIAWLTSDSEELLGDLFGPGGSGGSGSGGSGGSGGPGSGGSDAPGAGSGAYPAAPGGPGDVADVADPAAVTATAGDPDTAAAATPRGDSSVSPQGFVAAMPLARTLARELGLDLASMTATGARGEVLLADVVAAFKASVGVGLPGAATQATLATLAAGVVAGNGGTGASEMARAQPPAPEDPRPLLGDAKQRRTRVAVNRLMNASAVVPQFTLRRALDLSATNRVRKTDLGGASWTTIVVKAYALALTRFEGLNAEWTDAGVRGNAEVNVAVAVDTPTGLMVPVVRGAAAKPLAELDAEVKALAARARDGALNADDMTGATGSVSNLGGFGVESFNALLTPPQATALSVGTLRREVIFDESLRTRPVLDVGLTVDHRVADGAAGAKFLQAMQELLDAAQF
ncbi:2-oxo acid dehydrogenase subunit E2 [Micrococcales bacterium 31B]|nr:2-oxo acid dehydrogenase subunit E2 [Micrococcales bacterium 31B]